jgi:hypothetical protein
MNLRGDADTQFNNNSHDHRNTDSLDHGTSTGLSELTQLLARQTIQQLPEFSGDAREFPRFKCIYQQTNEIGHFTNVDNLIRLDKALKGRARATVEALLFDPENVDIIMKQLEEYHGQADVVLNDLMMELRKMKPPRDGCPKAIITFSQKLNNLVANTKALRKEIYLYNPMEIRYLVSRLPTPLQIKWTERCAYRGTEPTSSSDLNKFLIYHASIIAKLPTTSKYDLPTISPRERTNIHTEEMLFSKYGCCKRNGHKTTECRQFLSFSVSKR